MIKKHINGALINGALIAILCNEIPNSTLFGGRDNKFHLRPTEELALPDDSQLHIAKIPDGPRLCWPVVAHYSGIQLFPQPKSNCYEVPNHFSNGLLVNAKTFNGEPS